MNLRERAADDLRILNTADWGREIELIDPDGGKYSEDAETGDTLKAVHVGSDFTEISPGSGSPMRVEATSIVVSRASLERVPKPGETWLVNVALRVGGDKQWMAVSPTKANEGGQSLDVIRLYPQETENE